MQPNRKCESPGALSIRLLTLAALAILSASPLGAAPNDETPVSCDSANEPIWICYGEYLTCNLTVGDVDHLRFFGVAGDPIRISMTGKSKCLDPRVQLRDPGNNILLDTYCTTDCNHYCSFQSDVLLPTTGVYNLFVDEAGNTETGNFLLALDRIPPLRPIDQIAYNSNETVTIDYSGDLDFLTFQGERGSEIKIVASGQTKCLDPKIELLDPFGLPVGSKSATADCNHYASFTWSLPNLPESGTYTMVISDAGATETGTMIVTLNCIYSPSGNCPPPVSDGVIGTNYCTSNPNSTGVAATISAFGSEILAEDYFFVMAADVPIGDLGLLLASESPTQTPFGSGYLCVGPPQFRLGVTPSSNTGQMIFVPDLTRLPALPGRTWHFQAWFRDGGGSNTTDGVAVTFQ